MDTSERPELDSLHDFIEESILTEEGKTAEESMVMRVLKNDYAGILEQADVEVEHIPEEEISALRAEVERLRTELETSREETKSKKRKFKALVDAIGRAMEKARNAGRLTSPKAIVEMIKAEITGQIKDAPDASDSNEDR